MSQVLRFCCHSLDYCTWGCVGAFEFLQISASGGGFVEFFVCFEGILLKLGPKSIPAELINAAIPAKQGCC